AFFGGSIPRHVVEDTDAGGGGGAGGRVQTTRKASREEARRAGAASEPGIEPVEIAFATCLRSARARLAAPHESRRCSAAASASLSPARRFAVARRMEACLVVVRPQAAGSRQAQAPAPGRNGPRRAK